MQFNSNYNEQQQWNTNQHQPSAMQSPQIDQTGLPSTAGDDSLGASTSGAASCTQKSTERMRQDEGECYRRSLFYETNQQRSNKIDTKKNI